MKAAMARPAERREPQPETILLLIAAYFALAVVLRLIRPGAVESDEAEQLLLSQLLLPGHGRQPPFYDWLQYGAVQLFGPSILALSLLKNLLLALTCLFSGLTASMLLKDRRLVAIAVLGIIAMPVVSVMAQRDLTHAIAAIFAAALFGYGFFGALKRPGIGFYLIAGLAAGIGVISKYNFALLPAAAILAIVPEAQLRKRLLDPRVLAAIAAAALVCLPHGLWLLGNLGAASEGTLQAMRENASGNIVIDRLAGLASLALAVLAAALPVLAFFAIAFGRGLATALLHEGTLWSRVTARMMLAALLLVAAITLFLGATDINDKWLSPFLLFLPLHLCLKIEAAGIDIAGRLRRMGIAIGVFAVGALIYLALAPMIGPQFDQYAKQNFPARAALRVAGAAEGLARPDIVIAGDSFLAAGARLEMPQARVILPGSAINPTLATDAGGAVLIVWRAGQTGEALPQSFRQFLEDNGVDAGAVTAGTASVPMLYSGGRRHVVIGYAAIRF